MTLKEMVESTIEAFDPEEHREAFRALIEKVVTVTVAHLHAEGVMNDRKCHLCGAHDLACPNCDAEEFAKSECDGCGMPFSCETYDEESHCG
jgi:hypothetical protein